MKRLELRLVKQSTYRGILHPRERDYMAEFETPLQVGQGLLTTAYICAIEFRILPNLEILYMKKKMVQTTIKFTTFSTKKIIIKFYAKK